MAFEPFSDDPSPLRITNQEYNRIRAIPVESYFRLSGRQRDRVIKDLIQDRMIDRIDELSVSKHQDNYELGETGSGSFMLSEYGGLILFRTEPNTEEAYIVNIGLMFTLFKIKTKVPLKYFYTGDGGRREAFEEGLNDLKAEFTTKLVDMLTRCEIGQDFIQTFQFREL